MLKRFLLLTASVAGLTTPAYSQSYQGAIEAVKFGAICDGTGDDTAGVNKAIAAGVTAGTNRGGTATILLPAGICHISGTLAVAGSNVTLQGAGMFATTVSCFSAGTADCVTVGAQASQITGITIRDLTIQAPNRTGGNCLQVNNASRVLISRANVQNCFNNTLVTITNNVIIEHSRIVGASNATGYAVKWTSPANNTQRSDVLTLFDVSISASYSGADCIDLDGMVQTLHLTNVIALQCGYGLRVQNTAADASFYPAFVYGHDVEIEGAMSAAARIDAGHTISFTNSDFYNFHGASGQGGADTDCVIVNPDTGHSNTHNVRFSGGRVGGCNNRAMNLNGLQIHAFDVQFTSISQAGASVAPAIEVGASASQVDLIGIKTYFQGDTVNASWALIVDAGATGVTWQGDCRGAVNGCVRNSGTVAPVNVLPGFDQAGNPYEQGISLRSFGAKCDGTTDDTTAIQAWLNYGASHANSRMTAPGATCVFTSALTAVGSQWTMVGAGPYQTIFLYTGASTTADLLTFGNGGSANRLAVSGFTVRSNTVMTAGYAMRLKGVTRSFIDNINLDGQDGNGRLWHGIYFDGNDNTHFDHFEAKGQGDCLSVRGDNTTGKADLYVDHGKIGGCGVGIRIGGNFGGFVLDESDVIANGTNVIIDQTLQATANRELFFGAGAWIDSATSGPGVSIADTGAGFVYFTGAWIASSSTHGISIASGVNMTIVYAGGTIFNNAQDGIHDASGSTAILNLTGVRINASGAFGINATTAAPKIGYAGLLMAGNASGNFSTNVASTTQAAIGGYTSLNGLVTIDGQAPSCAVTGAGTSPTCAMSAGSNTVNGSIRIVAGTTPGASGTVTMTLPTAFPGPGTPACVAMYDSSQSTWATNALPLAIGAALSNSSVTFNWNNNGTNLTAANEYRIAYHCFGK